MGEEQRRAFAEFMGTTAQAGQVFYSYAGTQPPQAPTPPPSFSSIPAANPVPFMPILPRPPGYVYVPRSYTPQGPSQPAIGDYSVGWQYTNPVPPPNTSPHPPPDVQISPYDSRHSMDNKIKERYYYEYERKEDAAPPPIAPAAPLPVLLCHVCKDCGQMRSARFHRQHPVVPGKPLVSSSCRRCAKKVQRKEKERSSHRSIRVRTCKAEEPCNWPDTPIRIEVARGRSRHSRSQFLGVYFDPPDREPQTVRRSESRTNLGLRVLQETSPPRAFRREYSEERREAEFRLGPHPVPLRVLPDQRGYQEVEGPAISSSAPRLLYEHPQSPSRGILKHSSMNRETSYRHHMRLRDSQESNMVEAGGHRVQFASDADQRAERIMADRNREQSRQHAVDSNNRSEDHDYFHRRESSRYQYQDPPDGPPISSFKHVQSRPSSPARNYEDVRVRERSPVRSYEEVRIRHISPPSPRRATEEVRFRYVSPPPRKPSDEIRVRYVSPLRRTSEEIRIRHISPSPRGRLTERTDTRYDQSPERPAIGYRTFSRRTETTERNSSLPPRQKEREKEKAWDQVTATDSDNSGEIVERRSWRGVDERGEPATYVEERRTMRLLENEKVDEYRNISSPNRREYAPERREHTPERKYSREYSREYAHQGGSWRDV